MCVCVCARVCVWRPSSAGIKGVNHHAQVTSNFLTNHTVFELNFIKSKIIQVAYVYIKYILKILLALARHILLIPDKKSKIFFQWGIMKAGSCKS